MAEKKEVKIPEMLFFQEGPGVRNIQYTTSGVKLLNVANLVEGKVDLSTSDRYISEDVAYGKYNHFLCDEDDFIVASSGIKVDYIDKKMGFITKEMLPLCMNTSTIRFKVLDDSKLNIRYFMYFLKSNAFKKQLAKQITGSAQLNYGPSHLKQMTFPLIDIKSQNDLVKKLDYLIQIMDKKNESIRKYDDLIKARFVEMFGGIDRYISIKDSGLFIADGNYSSKYPRSSEFTSFGVPFIRANNIKDNTVVDDDMYFISPEKHDELKKGHLLHGDILVTTRGNIGQLGIVPQKHNNSNINAQIVLLRCRDTKYLPEYLLFALQTVDVKKQFIRQQTGTALKQLPVKHLEKISFIDAPVELQNQFATFVTQVDKSKFAL